MQRAGFVAARHELEVESESEEETMRCVSCQDEYDADEAGTCKECYEEANETEEELKREIEDLKAKVAFLRFWSPLDHHNHRSCGPCFTDVILVASSDEPPAGPPVPVPAHKAILVSNPIPPFQWLRPNCVFFFFGAFGWYKCAMEVWNTHLRLFFNLWLWVEWTYVCDRAVDL
jgi:hypothetical protein